MNTQSIIHRVRARVANCSGFKLYYFFKKLIFTKYHDHNGKRHFIWFGSSHQPAKDQRVFYLKINRDHSTSIICIQHWLDTAYEMGAFVFFVCDNFKFQIKLISTLLVFKNHDFAFIPSDRKTLKKCLIDLLDPSPFWLKVGLAMLTPYTHQITIGGGRKPVYNIDADDIEVLLPAYKLAKAFCKMEEIAEKENIDCFSMDVACDTWTFGVNWTFGVVYTRDPQKCIDILKKNSPKFVATDAIGMDYLSFVDKSEAHHNIDNVFNYLSKSGQLTCKSWYIEGCHVFHMPDTLIDASRTHYWKYEGQKVVHPFLSFFYNETVFSERPLLPFLHKIDLHYSDEDMHEYMIKERAGGRTPFSVPNSRLDVALALGYIDKKTYNKYWRCPTTVLILYFVVYFVA